MDNKKPIEITEEKETVAVSDNTTEKTQVPAKKSDYNKDFVYIW